MPDRFIRFLSSAALIMAAQVTGMGQGVAPRAEAVGSGAMAQPSLTATAPGERPAMLVDPNRKLTQGDLLSIRIEEDREAAVPLIVTPTGHISVEPIGQVKVAGLTPAQAATEIKRRLEGDYYYTATVRLSLDRVNQDAALGTVYLSGELMRVGPLPIYADRPLTLSQAVLQAGGISKFGDKKKVIVYRAVPGGETKKFEINYRDIVERGKIEQDLLLQDGDKIFVPRPLVVF